MKSGTQAPPPVNVGNLIGQQGNANITSAEAQSGLNNAGVAGPLGASWWTPTSIDPGTGRPSTWEQNQQLGQLPQSVFNNQANLAGQLAGQAGLVGTAASETAQAGPNLLNQGIQNYASQLPGATASYSGLPALPTSTTDFSNEVQQAQNAAYNTQAGYLNPQFAEKQSDLNQQLADQGITQGGSAPPGQQTAYERAQDDLARQQTFAFQQAQNAAVQAGNQEQQALFGENLGARQQGVNEANTLWGQPFSALQNVIGTGENLLSGAGNQLPALGSLGNFTWAGGLPSQGGTGSTVTPPNIAALQNAANQGNQNNFAGGQSILSGLGSLGNAALPSLFGSQGVSGFLGANPQTGILGSLFGGGGGLGAANAFLGASGAGTAGVGASDILANAALLGLPVGV